MAKATTLPHRRPTTDKFASLCRALREVEGDGAAGEKEADKVQPRFPRDGIAVVSRTCHTSSCSPVITALQHAHAVQEAPEIEVEYVSAPHEYEELLRSEAEPEPETEPDLAGAAGLGSSGGGLGFVSAGPPGADSGLHLHKSKGRIEPDGA